MRKLIYILCCFFSLFIALSAAYLCINQLIEEQLTFRLFTRILACIGWGVITYQITAKKYEWIQKLLQINGR